MSNITEFKLDFPIPRTLCGIHMGNGNLGALIWGKDKLHITVNRADFWDHRGGEVLVNGTSYDKIKEAFRNGTKEDFMGAIKRPEWPEDVFKPQRVPVGRFELALKAGDSLKDAVLRYETGEVTVNTTSGNSILLSLGTKKNLFYIEDKNNLISDISIKPSWDFPQSQEWLEKYAFKAPERIETDTLKGWVQPCPNDPSLATVCHNSDNGYAISLELGNNNELALRNAVDSTLKLEQTEFINENRSWWQNYWSDIAEINTPDSFFNEFYKYALYKFAGATSPESPIPAGLQGPWIEEYHRAQWSGDYHFNVNVQQVYTFALATGKMDHMLPLFDMIESEIFWDNMTHNANVMFGIDDGLLLTHAVDDQGFQCGWLSHGSVLDQACGGWTAQLYWLYYTHTLDKDFLAKRAWPFMCGIMRVYEEMLEEVDGKFSIPVAISAEYGCRNPNGKPAGQDPSYQFAVIHMLLKALLESCEILNKEPKSIWLEMKDKVPQFTTHVGLDPYLQPEERIAVWKNQDLEVCHRHHSHLGCIYPFDSLPEEISPEMEEIIYNSLDNWILMGMGQWSEWCIPWAAILQTRTGMSEAPIVLLNMWKEIFINEGMNTVYLPRFRGLIAHRRHDMMKPKEDNEVMQIDGTMGCATALLEMMAHTHSGTTKLFGGVPEKWQDASFKNIRLTGPFTVSGTKEAGKITEIKVKSDGGTSLKLDIGKNAEFALIQNGKTSKITLPCKLELTKGEEVVLTAK